jgi:hypothetical protein
LGGWSGAVLRYPILTVMAGLVVVNPGTAKWQVEGGGSESVVLREDAQTGALELFSR